MNTMGFRLVIGGLLLCLAGGAAMGAPFEQRLDLHVNGERWLGTMHTPYTEGFEEPTNKVYTHLYDFDGYDVITKDHIGRFCHHRGLFIGWNHTNIGEERYDTWHMRGATQQHQDWTALGGGDDHAYQEQVIHWIDDDGAAFIEEVRRIEARPGPDGVRIIDFSSTLTALEDDIELRGDSHHAGMQIRLHDEVTQHEETTEYYLQPGGEEIENDEVLDAWWVMCSAEVGGERYWVVHMTPPDHPTGVPMYSIRRYARFGAFFEPDLTAGEPKAFRFRIAVSESELSMDDAIALYEEYAGTTE